MARPASDPALVLVPAVAEVRGAPDPLALFASLTGGGTAADVLLLESADATSGAGERSLLIPRTALRVVCRDRAVRLTPLTPYGRALTVWCTRPERLPQATAVVEGDDVVVTFPVHPHRPLADAERLRLPSPLDLLRVLALGPNLPPGTPPFAHMVAGVFAYDLVDLFESLPAAPADPLQYPTFEWWVPEHLLVIDHVARTTTAIVAARAGGSPDAAAALAELLRAVSQAPPTPAVPAAPPDGAVAPASTDLDDAAFAATVTRLQRHVTCGDVFQIVPSRTFQAPCPNPLAAYTALRALNPSPYMFYVRGTGGTLFGASPETAVRVQREGSSGRRLVAIKPIAGTAPRGRTPDGRIDPEADLRLEAALRTDTKELAEHMMLVDLARNDVARVSRPGTRQVSKLLAVDRYSHVMHLVSEVQGTLAPDLDALHAYAGSLNMGTLVGAPKIRAAALLREVEATRRGPYGGAVGYLAHTGDLDTAIVIRSALVQDGVAHVRAGAGVVLDSDPAAEARETRQKARSVLRAIGMAAAAEGS